MTPYTLRPAAPEDAAFLRALLGALRDESFSMLPPEVRGPLVDLQLRAQEADYTRRYPLADHQVVVVGDLPVGRLLVDRTPTEIRLVDIALSAAWRGHGLGTAVVRALQEEARARRRPLRLHVAANNPARRLYERLGFRVVAEHPPDLEMSFEPAASS